VEKVLLIANARAGSASPRTKEVIVKALSADFKLEIADTEARDHASELARDAVDRDFDAVVVFGGDGTINEAAQGLVGTDVALGILPGGSTNVMARSLGVPVDPVEATAFVAERLRSGTRRRIHVGRINQRYFVFSAGMGLDAEVVRRVEADPDGKKRRGEMLYLSHALKVAFTKYRGLKPMITMEVEGTEQCRVLLAVCCNARPFTYFGPRPVDVCPEATLDAGLDIFGLTRIHTRTIPRIAWAVLVSRSHIKWKHSCYFHDVNTIRLTADHPLPIQADGDYLGEWEQAELHLVRDALDLLV
jgi:diacylglycerol kinase family enzyme